MTDLTVMTHEKDGLYKATVGDSEGFFFCYESDWSSNKEEVETEAQEWLVKTIVLIQNAEVLES